MTFICSISTRADFYVIFVCLWYNLSHGFFLIGSSQPESSEPLRLSAQLCPAVFLPCIYSVRSGLSNVCMQPDRSPSLPPSPSWPLALRLCCSAAHTVEGLSACHKDWWPEDLLVEVSEYKRRQLWKRWEPGAAWILAIIARTHTCTHNLQTHTQWLDPYLKDTLFRGQRCTGSQEIHHC